MSIDITRSIILPADEQVKLIKKAQRGDFKARNKLIVSNMRLILKLAHRWKTKSLDINDMVSEGVIGLIAGIRTFKPSLKIAPSTHFYTAVGGYMRRAKENFEHVVRVPISRQQNIRDYLNGKRKKLGKYFRIGLSESEVFAYTNGYDAQMPNDMATLKGTNLIVQQFESYDEVWELLECLSKRTRDVVVSYFGLGPDPPVIMRELAYRYGVTVQGISLLIQSALAEMKRYSYNKSKEKYHG